MTKPDMIDEAGVAAPEQPEDPTPSTPSKDKRLGRDRRWRVELVELRSAPVSEVAAENEALRRALADAIAECDAEDVGIDALDRVRDRFPPREQPVADSWRWTLFQSDVDGREWDQVGQGACPTRAEAVACAEHLRDSNTVGDVLNVESVDL